MFSEFKKTLNSLQSDVKNISTKIPIQKTLSNFVRYINDSEDYILHYLPTMEECDSYRSVPSLSFSTTSVELAGEWGENLTI